MTKPILTSLYAYYHDIGEYTNQQFKPTDPSLKLNQRRTKKPNSHQAPSTYVRLVYTSESERNIIEQFIQRQYKQHFNADIHHFFPILISVYQQSNDQLIGAVGLRYADQGSLFSEQYLNKPAEQLLARYAGQKVPRSSVIELGHFVIVNRRYLALVVRAIANFIGQLQAQWTVYTLSEPMVKAVNKLSIPTQFLASACADKLIDKQNHWGQYYRHKPAVYCSHTITAIQAIHNKKLSYERH
ncbi:thermostable hemolysin [Marinicella gelatinilytica]|uniref:thermostable hemolysin n=1 Tax=Marinicella gelatinilytica TaxID=2996017 RepID=UPI002260E777|nr:thermostable hemolysin [Marinicella gelatinilytica]MCX7544699.1 thermostable hemolysin [Marinicella gelatinilytica]